MNRRRFIQELSNGFFGASLLPLSGLAKGSYPSDRQAEIFSSAVTDKHGKHHLATLNTTTATTTTMMESATFVETESRTMIIQFLCAMAATLLCTLTVMVCPEFLRATGFAIPVLLVLSQTPSSVNFVVLQGAPL